MLIWHLLRKLWVVFVQSKYFTDCTAQKMKFSIKDFFSKCDKIRSFLRIWSHLLKKSLSGNFIFCAVLGATIQSLSNKKSSENIRNPEKRYVVETISETQVDEVLQLLINKILQWQLRVYCFKKFSRVVLKGTFSEVYYTFPVNHLCWRVFTKMWMAFFKPLTILPQKPIPS